MRKLFGLLALTGLTSGLCQAQNLATNSSLETGGTQPDGWELKFGPGAWENVAHTGTRGVSTVGAADCGALWRTVSGVPVVAGRSYVMRYWGLTTNAWGGNTYGEIEGAGWRRVNFCEAWSPYAFAAVMPVGLVKPRLRVGQCGINGTACFDDVEVRPALPVHIRVEGYRLGTGESFQGNRYTCRTRLAEFGSNFSRGLHEHSATFGGYEWAGYWELSGTNFVTYRHALAGLAFTNARIKATLSVSYKGDLLMDVSPDGQHWQEAMHFSPAVVVAPQSVETNVPAALLPAREIFVRLRTTGNMRVSEYQFQGEVPSALPAADGKTWFFEQEVPSEVVEPVSVADTSTGHVFTVAVRNPKATPLTLAVQSQTDGPAGIRTAQTRVVVPPQATNEVPIVPPTSGAGENRVRVTISEVTRNAIVFDGYMDVIVAAIRDSSFGARLPSPAACPVWWCGSTYKVGRERASPSATNEAVHISAARNEYEPFQLVLRPGSTLSNVSVAVSDFVSPQPGRRATIASTNVEICRVEYVRVTQPTDYSGTVGEHPDPLVPLHEPIEVSSRVNQPLWFTVFVPKDTPGGDYAATITLQAPGLLATVPVRLRVHDFSLPDVTHHRTAYAVTLNDTWHHLTNDLQRRAVWDLYMQNFARHRISPQWPHLYSPIRWAPVGPRFVHDFSEFDETMRRALDDYHFNGFNVVPLPNSLGGHARFSPQYCALLKSLMQPIQQHLRERGWAEEAYCFWNDEPQPSVFPFVDAGMRAIHAAAPGLNRLLTLQPETVLYGDVDVWVPLCAAFKYLNYVQRARARQAAGDTLWWYVCLSPPAPRANNFIDHPAINQRIRTWLAETYDVRGELYWNTTWYMGQNGTPRNPWVDPMSGAGGNPAGNGDGMLLYPPTKTPPAAPLIAGPINSLRWELLREAQEDGEYLWLLKEVIQRAQLRLGDTHPAVMEGCAARAAALALVPSVSRYEREPSNLQIARQRMAEAIEKLEDGSPSFVSHPRSQGVSTGETTVLRAEALGWPLPDYQWRLNGGVIPGATGDSLALENCGPNQAGAYTVVASNPHGTITSAVAQVEGHWSEVPRIITQPNSTFQLLGETAIFTVTAVSSNVMSYQWLFNGAALRMPATRDTLVLRNLTPLQMGDYCVVINHASGVVTSAVARLAVVPSPLTRSILPTVASWGLQDPENENATMQQESEGNNPGEPAGIRPTPRTNEVRNAVVAVPAADLSAPPALTESPQRSPDRPGAPPRLTPPQTGLLALQPVAYWPLDESASPWSDGAGTNHFQLFGTNLVAGPGKVNGGVSNRLSYTDYLWTASAPELSYSGPFTVGGWFAYGPGTDMRADALAKADEFSLYYAGTGINRYRFEVGGASVQDQTSGPIGQWRWVVGWFDGTNANIQVDNGPVYSAPAPAPTATPHPLVALKKMNLPGGFAGDELFLFKRVLSADERAQIFTRKPPGEDAQPRSP